MNKVKAIIYKDEKSSTVFCIDGKIFFGNKGEFVNAKEAIKSIEAFKTYKVMPGMKERKEMIEKLLSMNYKDAAKFHLNTQRSKGRNGRIFEGEYEYE